MGPTVRVETVNERHPPVQAMSHNEAYVDVLHDIAGEVVQFLTTHEGTRSTGRLYNKCNPPKSESPSCCIHRNIFAPPYSCQLCRNAWILSQVSPYIRDCVMAHGRSQSLLWTRWYNERRREQEMPRWGDKRQLSQSSWIDLDGWSSHFSRDWAASYWDDDWASSSLDDDLWSGTRWHWSQEKKHTHVVEEDSALHPND